MSSRQPATVTEASSSKSACELVPVPFCTDAGPGETGAGTAALSEKGSPDPYKAMRTRNAQLRKAKNRRNITWAGVVIEAEEEDEHKFCRGREKHLIRSWMNCSEVLAPRVREPEGCRLPFPAAKPGAEVPGSLHFPLNSLISPLMYLSTGLVCLPAFEMVAEQQCPELPILMFYVILHSSLAWTAQLVGLLQMVLIHLNLLIIFALVRQYERKSRWEVQVSHQLPHLLLTWEQGVLPVSRGTAPWNQAWALTKLESRHTTNLAYSCPSLHVQKTKNSPWRRLFLHWTSQQYWEATAVTDTHI